MLIVYGVMLVFRCVLLLVILLLLMFSIVMFCLLCSDMSVCLLLCVKLILVSCFLLIFRLLLSVMWVLLICMIDMLLLMLVMSVSWFEWLIVIFCGCVLSLMCVIVGGVLLRFMICRNVLNMSCFVVVL